MSKNEVESGVVDKEPIFREINADDPNQETTEIDSACMNCFETGITRLLLTKIPFYKEVVLMSFKCEHCGFANNEIQSASEMQPKGVKLVLQVTKPTDLNRRIVRTDHAAVSIPDVELEIPAQTQKGEITTVEGIIERTVRGLSQDQEKRRIEHPDTATSIDAYIERLKELLALKTPFTVVLEDISGNSFIENPEAPTTDTACQITKFVRSKEQDQLLGLYEHDAEEEKDETKAISEENHLLKPMVEGSWPIEELHGEVLQFATICSNCRVPCQTNMKLTSVPHFKDVVIMATVCDACGCRTNEVKSGGGIEKEGIRFEVRIETTDDLSRDLLKSETCSLCIPELDIEVGPWALGGRFTTVEGLLVAMRDQLEGNGIMFQDSSDDKTKGRFHEFIQKFDQIMNMEFVATLVLDDPAGNSYVQSLSDDNEPDAKLKVERYERNFEQNEELGLNDLKTENYQT